MRNFKEVQVDALPQSLNTVMPAEEISPPSVNNVWVATNNIQSANFNLTHHLALKEATLMTHQDLFLGIAVAAGNFYKRILAGVYPAYAFGSVKTKDETAASCRLSRFIPNLIDFTTDVDEDAEALFLIADKKLLVGSNLLLKDHQLTKPINGLMAAFAVCFFFDDGDTKGDNLCLFETDNVFETVKIDPEAAFSDNFFLATQREIKDALTDIYETEYFRQFAASLLVYENHVQYQAIVDGLFKGKAAEAAFTVTLEKIINLSQAEIIEIFADAIDVNLYHEQINKLVAAFQKRQQIFKIALRHRELLKGSPIHSPIIGKRSLNSVFDEDNDAENKKMRTAHLSSVPNRGTLDILSQTASPSIVKRSGLHMLLNGDNACETQEIMTPPTSPLSANSIFKLDMASREEKPKISEDKKIHTQQ